MTAPLEGVHVLDLSWVMVGPASGRYLADLGADVIKVESSKRIDPVRTLGPFKDGKTGPERSVSYHNLNAGKRCVAIDIRRPEGREIVLRLADWADVVLESFTPGVLETLHLGYSRAESAQSRGSSWRRPACSDRRVRTRRAPAASARWARRCRARPIKSDGPIASRRDRLVRGPTR